jgi:hypothetical protein
MKRFVVLAASAMGLFGLGEARAGTLLLPGDVTTGGTAFGFPSAFGGPNNDQSENPNNLFDDNAGTKVLTFPSGTVGTGADVTAANPVTWGYDFAGTTAQTVLSYSLTSANDASDRDPRDFFIEGSNNGTDWTIVDTVVGHQFNDQPGVGDNTNTTDRFETYFFVVDAPGSYEQYRLRLIETRNTVNDRPQLAELQMFGTVVPEPALIGLVGPAAMAVLGRRRRK